MSTTSVGIHTHAQISEMERERRDSGDYLKDKHFNVRNRAKASYRHKRTWFGGKKDRYNGGYHYFGPGWMLPAVIATVTASIVWGTCGAMADMPEY